MAKEPYVNPNGNITDYLGFPLKPGDIVIHGYRGKRYGEPFDCGVFLRENESTLSIAKKGKRWNRQTRETEEAIKTTAIGKSYGTLTQPLVVISNPLFSMENKRILEALEVIDHLKSKGILPEDFQAGDNSQEYLDGEE
jgi:hypothetical protein